MHRSIDAERAILAMIAHPSGCTACRLTSAADRADAIRSLCRRCSAAGRHRSLLLGAALRAGGAAVSMLYSVGLAQGSGGLGVAWRGADAVGAECGTRVQHRTRAMSDNGTVAAFL
jgi:hypothetical protein